MSQIQTKQKRRDAAPQAIKPDSKPHRAAYRNANTHFANKYPASPKQTAGNRSPTDKSTAKSTNEHAADSIRTIGRQPVNTP